MSYVGYLNQEWNAGSTGLSGCEWGGAVLDMVSDKLSLTATNQVIVM